MKQMEKDETINLAKQLRLILKYKFLILLFLIVFLVIGIIMYKTEVQEFTATAKLIKVEKSSMGSEFNLKDSQNMYEIESLAKSSYLKGEIMKKIFIESPDVKTKINGETITLSFTHTDPKIASDVVYEMGNLIIQVNMKKRKQIIEKTFSNLDIQINETANALIRLKDSKENSEVEELKLDRLAANTEYTAILQEKVRLTISYSEGSAKLKIGNLEIEENDSEKRKQIIEKAISNLEIQINNSKNRIKNLNNLEKDYAGFELMLTNTEYAYKTLLAEKQKAVMAYAVDYPDFEFVEKADTPSVSEKKGIMLVAGFIIFGLVFSFAMIQLIEFIKKNSNKRL